MQDDSRSLRVGCDAVDVEGEKFTQSFGYMVAAVRNPAGEMISQGLHHLGKQSRVAASGFLQALVEEASGFGRNTTFAVIAN